MTEALFLIGVLILLFVLYEVSRVAWHIATAKRLGREAVMLTREIPGATERILIIGDSTSYGTGAKDPHKSLAGRIAAFFSNHAITNVSENSMSLARLVEKLEALPQNSYHTVFIHTGGVDTLQLTPRDVFKERLHRAVRRAKEFSPRVVVVSVNNAGSLPAFRFPLRRLYTNRSRMVSEACGEVCGAEGVLHAPLWEPTEEEPLRQDPKRLLARDGMHPSDEGYGVWFSKIERVLTT